MGRKVKEIVSILIAVLFLSSNFSLSHSGQKDIVEEANLLLDMMEYKAAVIGYLKILSKNPDQREIRKNIGYAYFQIDRIDDALKFLKEELELFPDNGDAYDLLIHILSKCKRIEEYYEFIERLDLPVQMDKENPNSGSGDFLLGTYFKEKREFNKTRIFFRKAIGRGYNPVKCFVQLADIEFIHDDFRALFAVLREARESCVTPNETQSKEYGLIFEFHFMYGLLYYNLSKTYHDEALYWPTYLQSALEHFKEALKLKPDSTDALINLGCIHYNHGQFKSASEYFKKILKRDPENAEVEFYLDCCLKMLKESPEEQISKKCPKYIELSKDFVDKPEIKEYQYQFKNDVLFVLENINDLALEFIKKGNYHESMRRYRNGLKIYPESPEINFNLGIVYFWLNDLREAERLALMSLRRKYFYTTMPDFLVPGKMRRYEREDFLRKAKESGHESPHIPLSEWTFDVALKEGNYFLEAYDLLGNIYFKKGEFDKSLLAFKKVIELKDKDAIGRYNLGCTYWALTERENAEMEWKKAIKYEKARGTMDERSKISDDELDVSLIVLNRPVSFRAHKSLGRLYLEQNLEDKALKEFKKALELEPDDPEPYFEIGKIYEAKSKQNERYVRQAIFYYEKYIYLGGEKEEEVKELLKSIK